MIKEIKHTSTQRFTKQMTCWILPGTSMELNFAADQVPYGVHENPPKPRPKPSSNLQKLKKKSHLETHLLKHVLTYIYIYIYAYTHQIDIASYNVMQSIILEIFPLNSKA